MFYAFKLHKNLWFVFDCVSKSTRNLYCLHLWNRETTPKSINPKISSNLMQPGSWCRALNHSVYCVILLADLSGWYVKISNSNITFPQITSHTTLYTVSCVVCDGLKCYCAHEHETKISISYKSTVIGLSWNIQP